MMNVKKVKKILFTTFFLLGCIGTASAFEIDGFKSGMSLQEAKEVLNRYSYRDIDVSKNGILARHPFNNHWINIGFCDGKIVLYQKDLKPRFDFFTKLVEEKRKECGKPVDAWSRPTNVTSNIESNSIIFVWKLYDTIITVDYIEFSTNEQLSITYETYNKCWEIPY